MDELKKREVLFKRIQEHTNELCSYLNDEQIRHIVISLYTQDKINDDFYDEILKKETTRMDRVLTLLKYLNKTDIEGIKCFLSDLQFIIPHLYTVITGEPADQYNEKEDVYNKIFYVKLRDGKQNFANKSQPVTSKAKENDKNELKEIKLLKQEIEHLKIQLLHKNFIIKKLEQDKNTLQFLIDPTKGSQNIDHQNYDLDCFIYKGPNEDKQNSDIYNDSSQYLYLSLITPNSGIKVLPRSKSDK